jgi:hypothetical protein
MNLTLVQGYRVNSPGKGYSNFNLVQNCLLFDSLGRMMIDQTDGINSSLTSQEISKMVDKVMQEIRKIRKILQLPHHKLLVCIKCVHKSCQRDSP